MTEDPCARDIYEYAVLIDEIVLLLAVSDYLRVMARSYPTVQFNARFLSNVMQFAYHHIYHSNRPQLFHKQAQPSMPDVIGLLKHLISFTLFDNGALPMHTATSLHETSFIETSFILTHILPRSGVSVLSICISVQFLRILLKFVHISVSFPFPSHFTYYSINLFRKLLFQTASRTKRLVSEVARTKHKPATSATILSSTSQVVDHGRSSWPRQSSLPSHSLTTTT